MFIDEIHRFSKSQQDSLLNAVEKGLVILIGATTENPSFEVISPLLSRCQVYVLKSLEKNDLDKLLDNAVSVLEKDFGKKIELQEKEALMASKTPFVATVPKSYDLSELPITCKFADQFSDFPLQAFVCYGNIAQPQQADIQRLCETDDGVTSTANAPEPRVTALYTELPFVKLTGGFVQAIALALGCLMAEKFPIISTKPMLAVRLTNGKDRLYLYNTEEDHYDRALITSPENLKTVEIVSHYPVLPPRFVQQETTAYSHQFDKQPERTDRFQVKLAPGGVTIVDIET